MQVRIHEIKIKAQEAKGLSPQELEQLLLKRTGRRLRLPSGSLRKIRIAKESLDAREKPDVYRVFSVDVLDSEFEPEELLAEARRAHVKAAVVIEEPVAFPEKLTLPDGAKRPVIAGFGPCGIFAALTLAKAGLQPIVLERGAAMEDRVAAVEKFWNEGILDPRTNVQFGEGGAGSFSDGKLTTGTKDPVYRLILQTFADAGADPDILYKQHPHVGTDVLRTVVVTLRHQIEALGGEVRFRTQLTDLTVADGALQAVEVLTPDGTTETIETDALILALGHSARDSFAMLYEQGLLMEQKQFSMGVRIEHPQKAIDLAQLAAAHEDLGVGAAEYKLSVRTKAGRGVYTFCMCPGGSVVASASEEGGLCTNGMSLRARNGENANSGLLVDVRPEDFGSDHPLAGMEFQRRLEERAWQLGQGRIPVEAYTELKEKFEQTYGQDGAGDFRDPDTEPAAPRREEAEQKAADAAIAERFVPVCIEGGWTSAPLHTLLPADMTRDFIDGMEDFGRRIKGFNGEEALVIGLESRTSSPVRIPRGEDMQSTIRGLYPCGEGAGYAGGIMSAAMDGMKTAEAIRKKYSPMAEQDGTD